VIRGAGLAVGAATLGGLASVSSAYAGETPGGTPGSNALGTGAWGVSIAPTGDISPSVLTPGLSYRTYGQFSFMPNSSANGYGVSGEGCYCTINNGYVIAPLDLPVGARIEEATYFVYCTGGTPMIAIERYAFAGFGSDVIRSFSVNTSGAQTVNAFGIGHVIDPDYTYIASVYTNSSGLVRAKGLRIGYSQASVFGSVDPQVRKLDTREPGPLTGRLLGGQTRTLALTPQLPSTASSALVNLTITETDGSGYLSLYPAGTSWPGTSSINWSGPGQTLASSVTVAVSSTGSIDIRAGGGGSTQVVVDLLGFYQ